MLTSSSTRLLVCAALTVGLSGCIALKVDQDELAEEVAKLRNQVVEQDQKTGTSVDRANELANELESKLAEVEEVLRRNQADLGLRVNNLEVDVQELRGSAESADYMASAVKQDLMEVRGEFDARLQTLEEKLNEATNIPESAPELWVEAEKQFKARKYKQSRRLWRTYESRYPTDAKMAEVRFNIGLTFFSEREYKSALGEFYRIIQESPKASVIPDALYYSGLAFAKLGQCKNAIAYFDVLRARKTKAPAHYKSKATEQIGILKKDTGGMCTDKKPKPAS